jgi:hypothetical protein
VIVRASNNKMESHGMARKIIVHRWENMKVTKGLVVWMVVQAAAVVIIMIPVTLGAFLNISGSVGPRHIVTILLLAIGIIAVVNLWAWLRWIFGGVVVADVGERG